MDTEVSNRFTERKLLKLTEQKREELKEVQRENELAFYEVEKLIAQELKNEIQFDKEISEQ